MDRGEGKEIELTLVAVKVGEASALATFDLSVDNVLQLVGASGVQVDVAGGVSALSRADVDLHGDVEAVDERN